MPEDLTSAGVEVDHIDSYLTGDFEMIWENTWGRTIPVDVTPVESTVLGRESALVSGLDAEEARLSPLGLTLIFPDYEIDREDVRTAGVSVKLADGAVVEAPWGGVCGIFRPPYDENSSRVLIWNFREPVDVENIEGIYVGDEYFSVK